MKMPNVPDDWNDIKSEKPEVGECYLPGLGQAYLHPEFADKVGDFIQRTNAQGISLRFESGYRDQEKQDCLQNDPTAITPVRQSLHSAGRGVDIVKMIGRRWTRVSRRGSECS